MKMLREIIDCKSLNIFLENIYDEVHFSKIKNLLLPDCDTFKEGFSTDSSWNFYRKIAFFEREFCEKSLWWASVLDKLWPCGTQTAISSKNWANVRLLCRRTENSNMFTGKSPWWRLLFSKFADLESISAI